jgi:hypothetical protein
VARPARRDRLIGRNSLFVFILQQFLYDDLLIPLRLPYTPLWLLLVLSLFPIALAARAWDARGLNRHLRLRPIFL